ncbi:hypothetical protein Ait01nite_058740 [Actinoplanes italicus]|uniref:Uncharacterized protein n=1 Tax=Actinoplanes italicus TaxID=113567 RepID=A0A2T0K6R6_9ACTN|nr:hypothetical protein [Actinoplanes italicus]PRX18419.1 hypothetical protein CLV67_113256 [Actinoplanes italicus]GIE32829.1 hypothetical protein Ait01nite_058740 [Actinoplanes italicus]
MIVADDRPPPSQRPTQGTCGKDRRVAASAVVESGRLGDGPGFDIDASGGMGCLKVTAR